VIQRSIRLYLIPRVYLGKYLILDVRIIKVIGKKTGLIIMSTMFSFKFMKKSKSVAEYPDGKVTLRNPSPHPLRRRASSADTVRFEAYLEIEELRLQAEQEQKKQKGSAMRTRKKSTGRKSSQEKTDDTLYDAITHENIANVKDILAMQTVDVNAYRDFGWTILHHACLIGNTEIIRLLLEAGANPALSNRQGISPLRLAVKSGNFEAASYLIHEHGVSCDEIRDGFQENSPILYHSKGKSSKLGKV